MRRTTTLFAVLCAAVILWGCPQPTPEEKVAKARARYSVTLNGFFAREPAPPAIEVAEEEMAAVAEEAAVAAEEGEGEEGEGEEMAEPEGPRSTILLFDLIVQHDLDEALPGITVDLQMVDPDKNEKGAWKIYIETAGLPEANQKQVTHEIEVDNYEEGDLFSVEIRSPIPPEEYGAYREFAETVP